MRSRPINAADGQSPGMLSVAEEMLAGEVEYRSGNFDVAFAHLRKAVDLEDGLHYDEPWGWMQPVRYAFDCPLAVEILM